jgi:hypothetical protein
MLAVGQLLAVAVTRLFAADPAGKDTTVTGAVTEKNGQKTMTPTKGVVDKS